MGCDVHAVPTAPAPGTTRIVRNRATVAASPPGALTSNAKPLTPWTMRASPLITAGCPSTSPDAEPGLSAGVSYESAVTLTLEPGRLSSGVELGSYGSGAKVSANRVNGVPLPAVDVNRSVPTSLVQSGTGIVNGEVTGGKNPASAR